MVTMTARIGRAVCGGLIVLLLMGTSGWGPPITLNPLVTLGELEGDGPAVFGLIYGIAAHSDGAFLLDSRMLNVRAIDRSGRIVGTAGQPGAGPGELSEVAGVSVDALDRVHVLDVRNGRIAQYAGTEWDELRHVEDIRIPFSARAICHIGQHMFLRGVHEGAMIHRLDRDGSVHDSFGRLPDPVDDPSARRMGALLTAGGLLACGPTPSEPGGVVVTASHLLPEVTAYSASGEVLWSHSLEDFRSAEFAAERGGVVIRRPQEGLPHDITGLVVLPSGRVLVQFGTRPEGGGGRAEITSVETRVLSPTGAKEWSGDALPRIDAVSGDRAYSIENIPFPRVTIHELTEH